MTSHADSIWVPVTDAGSVGTVRRAATALGADLRLPEQRQADLAIIATEMASNLFKHGVDGVALVQVLRRGNAAGVEILAVDKGPGLRDLPAAQQDGQSTSGTLGIGLGAIVRLASEYDAYSWPGSGTVVAATIWPETPPPEPAGFSARGITRAMAGEEVTGDGYGIRLTGAGHLQVMLCDGLGHGPMAASAALAAEAAFRDAPETGPKAIIEYLHRMLNHTRGAVVTVVDIDPERDQLRFAGVGNVAGAVIDAGQRRVMVAQPGIAGHTQPQLREVELPCPPSAVVVLHSDGVVDRWNLADLPGLVSHTPVVLAAVLMRDAGVRRDDAAVLVARRRP